MYFSHELAISFSLVPLKITAPFLETEKLCCPTPIVKFVVWMPASTVTVTGALLPLVTVSSAGSVSIVAANTTSARYWIPLGGPRVSLVQIVSLGVVLYQYTSWSDSTVGESAPDL